MRIARTLLAVASMSLGISAYSQEPIQQPWTVKIPFDFTVRNINLEAGQYKVKQFGSTVILTSQDGKTANVMTNKEYTSQPSNHSSLVFHKVDGEYALSQIKTQGSATELDAVVGKHASKRLEASTGSQSVEVAAVGTR